MTRKDPYWQAVLTSPPYSLLTYAAEPWLPDVRPGMRVLAPLGRGVRAVVLDARTQAAPPGVTVKPLIWPLERDPVLSEAYLDLCRTLAARQMAPLGRILEALLPRGLRSGKAVFELRAEGFPRTLTPIRLAALGQAEKRRLAECWAAGRMNVRERTGEAREEPWAVLAQDPPWPIRPAARRQMELLEYLLDHGPRPLDGLAAALGDWVGPAAARLERSGVIRLGPPPMDGAEERLTAGTGDSPPPDQPLTGEQAAALQGLCEALAAGPGQVRLVHGVTGSGKTRLYLELAAKVLASGRSVLLLAPEVALAYQLYRAASARFPDREPLLFHGYQSPAKREGAFLRTARSIGPVLAVGTRSALFLPMPRLGLIVLDEEHDESFKQEERLSYQSKEVAFFRAGREGGLLVLGSATPDVKTFYASEQGGVPRLTLAHRVGACLLPEVRLVDVSRGRDLGEPLAGETLALLRETVAAGDQAILMLNRRGYAPLIYCRDCEAPVKCPNCDVALTLHKGRERALCHYCGRSAPYPMACPACGGSHFLAMGEGTERLEEFVRGALPAGASVLRMDRDSTRRQERLEAILADFAQGRAQVLVGTQMLSKGHHFPGVTLVAAVEADLGLYLPDYRSAERSFQLLVQVAGRAGRGERPGRVLIQTRNPSHPFWGFVIRSDYEGFYRREIELRRKFRYPPFVKLALVRASHAADWEDGPEAMAGLFSAMREAARAAGATVLGPSPAPLALLKGRRRFHCLLKAGDWPTMRAVFARMLAANPAPARIRLTLDLDPVNML